MPLHWQCQFGIISDIIIADVIFQQCRLPHLPQGCKYVMQFILSPCHATPMIKFCSGIFFVKVARMTDPRSWWSVQTSVVARAMLRSSLKEGEGGVLEHKDVVALGKE